MSDKDEHKSDDAVLTSYLEGSDGLSDAYRTLSREQPPAHLDARILAAAQGAEVENARRVSTPGGFNSSSLRGLVSLAASLGLGIMIGAVFLGDPELQPEAASSLEKAVSQGGFPPPTEAAPRQEADRARAAESFAVSERVAPEPQVQATQVRLAAEATPVNQTAPRGSVNQQRNAAPGGFEEIVVTGSRLQQSAGAAAAPAADDAGPDYRQSVVSWLVEIYRLEEQLRGIESIVLQQQLDEEVALFEERYPGINLVDEIGRIRTMDTGD